MNMLEQMRAESLVGAPVRPHETEFQRFIETIKALCIPHAVHHGNLPKDPWQQIILDAGFEVTSYACFYVQIGDIQFVFSTGQPHWTCDPNDPEDCSKHEGHGPDGAFLLTRNASTSEINHRKLGERTGLDAMRALYRF